MKNLLLLFIPLCFLHISCSSSSSQAAEKERDLSGTWRGLISLQEKELPFNFEIKEAGDSLQMHIFNAEEELVLKDLYFQGDTLHIPMHIFDAEIRAVVESGSMKGKWVKQYVKDYALPFSASRDDFRFSKPTEKAAANLSGKWAVTFKKEQQAVESFNAIGLFEQEGEKIKGTFLTATGDYRFLEGKVDGPNLKLSSFDGENAYLFEGRILQDDKLEGTFWSGKGRKEKWTAVRDEEVVLPDADSLTFLKEDYDKLAFTFPDLDGKMISLSNPKYQDKVVIVQILGSWCPNCMDETRFLANWYKKNKDEEVAIIGLAYEKKDDFEYASQRVKQMAEKLGAEYDFLIAGAADKDAAQSLPMLNHIMSFPTTIFLDKEGNVRKIHTGFSGPGTGEYYTRFVNEFNLLMDKLLRE